MIPLSGHARVQYVYSQPWRTEDSCPYGRGIQNGQRLQMSPEKTQACYRDWKKGMQKKNHIPTSSLCAVVLAQFFLMLWKREYVFRFCNSRCCFLARANKNTVTPHCVQNFQFPETFLSELRLKNWCWASQINPVTRPSDMLWMWVNVLRFCSRSHFFVSVVCRTVG